MFALTLSVLCLALVGRIWAEMPLPFTRELFVADPVMTGSDVLIAQTLLLRDDAVDKSLVASGNFGDDSGAAVSMFQTAHYISASGILDSVTAQKLLDLHSDDQYHDSGFTAASMGYLYKIHIPVHTNRSIETYSTLFDKDNNVMLKFKTRTHGYRADDTTTAWPDYGNGDIGRTQFYSNGTCFVFICVNVRLLLEVFGSIPLHQICAVPSQPNVMLHFHPLSRRHGDRPGGDRPELPRAHPRRVRTLARQQNRARS